MPAAYHLFNKMRSMNFYAPLLCLSLGLVACDQQPSAAPPQAPGDPNLVHATPELLQKVVVTPLGERELTETLRVPARVSVDELRMARIGAAVTGRLMEIHVQLGERVHRGDLLATLHNTELSVAQLAYLKALSHEVIHERAVKRAKLLFDSDVISAAELQRRESELIQAQAERQASHDQLRVLGMPEKDIRLLAETRSVNSISSVIATLEGTVIERNVAQGQVVQPADTLFTIADLSHVWVIAEVPEQQAGLVKTGDTTEAEVTALDQPIKGKLIFVSDTLNADTRTVTVRMDVENQDVRLKPGMLASMLIHGTPRKRLALPVSAIVRENNRDHVFIHLGDNRFKLHPVTLGQESGGITPVLEGLTAGEPVVTEGAFHLNNERLRKALEG